MEVFFGWGCALLVINCESSDSWLRKEDFPLNELLSYKQRENI